MIQAQLVSILLLIATFFVVILSDLFKQQRFIRGLTLGGLALAVLALLFFPHDPTSYGVVQFDLYSLFFVLVFLIVAFIVAIASKSSGAAFHASLLLSTLGMTLASSADDLIMLYVSIELVTAPTYVLVAYRKTEGRLEAATKYFVISILASAFLILGLGLLALSSATTSLAAFVPGNGPLFLLGVAGVLAGLGFKLGVFPFNFWIPDVYQGAPAGIAGLLAGASKKAGFAAFIKIALVIAVAVRNWTLLIAVLAALTMTVPNVIALLQKNARRLLAYSIMVHAGFLLMGVALLSPLALSGTLMHVFTHAFMALGAFLVFGVFAGHKLQTIEQLNGLGWRNKWLGASLVVFLLSLAGIPLLSGFASKLYLFYVVAKEGLLWLTILAIANSAISLYYYFRIIKAMYGEKGMGKPLAVRKGVWFGIIICLAFTVLFGLYPVPLIQFAVAAAGALF